MYGDVQLSNAAASILQVKPPESGEVNVKLGVESLVGDCELGPPVIASPILQVLVAGVPTFPASSLALTWKLC